MLKSVNGPLDLSICEALYIKAENPILNKQLKTLVRQLSYKFLIVFILIYVQYLDSLIVNYSIYLQIIVKQPNLFMLLPIYCHSTLWFEKGKTFPETCHLYILYIN